MGKEKINKKVTVHRSNGTTYTRTQKVNAPQAPTIVNKKEKKRQQPVTPSVAKTSVETEKNVGKNIPKNMEMLSKIHSRTDKNTLVLSERIEEWKQNNNNQFGKKVEKTLATNLENGEYFDNIVEQVRDLCEKEGLGEKTPSAELYKIVNETSAERYEKEAQSHFKKKEDSWERSDTDGFVSQWASGVMAAESRMKADLERNGGRAEFPVLADAETGELVPARMVNTRYGVKWAVFNSADDANHHGGEIVEWVGLSERAIKRKGYREGWQNRKAKVGYHKSNDRGLSGAMNVHPSLFPNDDKLFNENLPVNFNDDDKE